MKWISATKLEADVALLGIKLVIENGWNQVEIESDSKVVIKQLKGTTHHWCIETTCSIIASLAEHVTSIEWKTIHRTANEGASWVAKQSRKRVCLND